jgi:uncharacterized protein (TIGR03437 family)
MRLTHCLFMLGGLLAVSASAQTPVIAGGGVLNAASFARGQAVSAGSLVSIFGSELAAGLAQADSVPLSTSLTNVSVTFNGVPAPLLFVSSGQINAQVPWNVLGDGVSTGAVDVVVTRAGARSGAATVNIGPSNPGLFSIQPGAGYAIAINADGSIAAPEGAIPGFPTHPAKIGDALVLLATGLGAVDATIANGAASLDRLRTAVIRPGVFVGGHSAQVLFAGLTPQFPGVNQLNVIVPETSVGASIPIQLEVSGTRTSDQIVIAVGR